MKWAILFVGLLAQAAEPVRLLWAGSSSVYYHDLPDQVASHLTKVTGQPHESDIAGRSGDSIQVYLKPGTFKPEYGLPEGTSFLDKIREGRYNFVVLQVVTHFLMGPKGAELEEAVEIYARAIRQAGGQPVIYEMGWGREPINDEGRASMRTLAKRLGVRHYAPVSTAWKLSREARPDLELHNLPDRTHPGTVGHFLNLAVLASAILGKPATGIPRAYSWWPNLDTAAKEQAAKLHEANGPRTEYQRRLPVFLQVRAAASRENTLDEDTARFLEQIAAKAITQLKEDIQ
jgi:hypothetical protein